MIEWNWGDNHGCWVNLDHRRDLCVNLSNMSWFHVILTRFRYLDSEMRKTEVISINKTVHTVSIAPRFIHTERINPINRSMCATIALSHHEWTQPHCLTWSGVFGGAGLVFLIRLGVEVSSSQRFWERLNGIEVIIMDVVWIWVTVEFWAWIRATIRDFKRV